MVSPPQKTKFPPVNDCLRVLRFSDYLKWGGATVGCWGYGFVTGRPARFAMAGLMAGIGFTYGSLLVIQNTRDRLMGFRENDREVKKYGVDADSANVAPEDLIRTKLDWKQFK
jgi:hypothetical protein